MSRHIQKVPTASLNVFKLLKMCDKFQVNSSSLLIKNMVPFFIRLYGIKDSLATAYLIYWE